ncbi:MAG: hypothetical protein IH977_06050 [Nitrospinae bacterium]|nr:hypothetical protein [Nitrospinota bacterium]
MSDQENDQAFVAFAKQQLDQSVEPLDSETVTRLRAMRYEALHSQPQRIPWLWPASGLATACTAILALVLWWSGPTENGHLGVGGLVEDLDLLAAADNFDLYEDLEFYSWLAEQDQSS